jgi:hypothetical protein
MMAKIIKGSDFKGVVDYIFLPVKFATGGLIKNIVGELRCACPFIQRILLS